MRRTKSFVRSGIHLPTHALNRERTCATHNTPHAAASPRYADTATIQLPAELKNQGQLGRLAVRKDYAIGSVRIAIVAKKPCEAAHIKAGPEGLDVAARKLEMLPWPGSRSRRWWRCCVSRKTTWPGLLLIERGQLRVRRPQVCLRVSGGRNAKA